MNTSGMDTNLLLYVGSGIWIGAFIVGIGVGIVYSQKEEFKDFRYGVCYSTFALVAAIGLFLASIAFYFQFLSPHIAWFGSIISLAFVIALLLMAVFIKKNSRMLFTIMSFYCLILWWFIPFFVWNMIYLLVITKRKHAVQRTAGKPAVADVNR